MRRWVALALLAACAHPRLQYTVEPARIQLDGPMPFFLRKDIRGGAGLRELRGHLKNVGSITVDVSRIEDPYSPFLVVGSRLASVVCDGQSLSGHWSEISAMYNPPRVARPLAPGASIEVLVWEFGGEMLFKTDGHSRCVARFAFRGSPRSPRGEWEVVSNEVVVESAPVGR